MTNTRKLAALCGAVGLALTAISGTAAADGYEVAAPAAPADEGRKFTYSFNLGVVSDYVFRGISQSDNDPTIQGGVDIGYGIFYAGWWASGVDFGGSAATNDARVEMDWYAGIKPTWREATFDFGVIYYTYPGESWIFPVTDGPQLNYVELKAGVSGELFKNMATGLNVYWSPDSFAETGSVWTIEGNAGYTFHQIGPFVPTINGVVGYVTGGDEYSAANGFNNYWYWNAGLALAVDKLTFDFRYWGTDASNSTSNTLTCINDYCDGRFVFSAKVVLP
ncbi:TorF family putative porin [Hyphomicrobium sp. NDB2Meth4]|uniref:TorF family putative porin n=1 Tax=Hyphomicrobium sp. NDB2Meth4 TaxID=1892846 RepID=UPI00092FFA10|nr:TorF family putative porin [Hyphomicrobium sp. NDB2Meth4]